MMRRSGTRISALAVALMLLGTAGAEAKTFEVTRLTDPAPGNCKPNDCSLREAVLAANVRPGADRIVLPEAKRYKLTRANPGGVPEDVGDFGDLDILNDPVSIVHPGSGRARIDGNDFDRVLHIQAGARTALARLVVTGGDAGGDDGGGILTDADLKLSRTSVLKNASDDGGGIDAIGLAGVKLVRSQVRNNSADDDGGAINGADGSIILRRSRVVGNEAGDAAGGIRTTSGPPRVALRQSSVVGNRAGDLAGGLEISSEKFLMLNSTVANNRADGNGGGVYSAALTDITINSSTISGNRSIDTGGNAHGGGLYFDGPSVNMTNSTIANNRADQTGGGIHARDGADLALNAVTVTRNIAVADAPSDVKLPVAGGGLYRLTSLGFDVRNSLIALNTEGQAGSPSDCGDDGTEINSLGDNLISSTAFDCDAFDQPGDLVRANPKIGKLRRNGGPTKTVALRKGSPAIGKAHHPSAPNRDQRNRKRDSKEDIGAYERGA